MKPTIKIYFCLTGRDLPFDIISEELGIAPSCARKKSEWPLPSIKAGIAADIWQLTIPYHIS